MAQFARPDSDISNTSDEEVASDTDYIRGNSTAGACVIGLSSVTDPQSSTGHIIRVRARANGSGAGERWTFQVRQGSTIIETLASNATLARAWTNLSATLTAGEADSITDYSALSIYAIPTTIAAGESIDISWVELEVPDAPEPVTRRVFITHF